jgi:integrase
MNGALRLLRKLYGSTRATAFGPKRLRVVREAMVRGDPHANPPRQPWTRSSINKQTKNLVKLFKWAASHELVPVTIYQTLQTVEPLKRGQTPAVEAEPIRPITPEQVAAVRPFLSRPLLALIDLQLYTGARGGELFKLRKKDIDRSGDVWVFRPDEHKTAYRGKKRAIYFGPRAQEILKPFLERDDDAFLFSPREGAAERRALRHERRKTPMSCGSKPGDRFTRNPARPPGGHYHRNSYVRAVARACEAAFPPPKELARQRVKAKKGTRAEKNAEWKARLGPEKWKALRQWRKEHRWHPHQLRHTAATNIRRDCGLEAAQLALGHSSALITDAIYAERDMEKVIDVMKRFG